MLNKLEKRVSKKNKSKDSNKTKETTELTVSA